MLLFTPLALGSFWGLLAFPPILMAIAVRLNEEEKFLSKNLHGYKEYMQKVRYRLIPLSGKLLIEVFFQLFLITN